LIGLAVGLALSISSVVPALRPPDGRPEQVREYLAGRPLEPLAGEMVRAADYYGIDWRLLPVLAVLESSGGLKACGGNAWGWDGCRTEFPDFERGVWFVAARLAEAPYDPLDVGLTLCVWRRGDGCHDPVAASYRDRALWEFRRLPGQRGPEAE
jgi:hypothetical protein